MPKPIDLVPISVARTKKTLRYEIIVDNAGELVEILAHRWLFTLRTTNGLTETSTPEYKGVIRIPSASVPVAVKNKIADIETLVDNSDL